MSKALWPSVSGAVARGHHVEVIANNLSNVNTDGFKKDQVDFQEYLAQEESIDPAPKPVAPLPWRDRDLHPIDGRDQSFVVVNGTYTQHKQGGLKITDNPLDMALNGNGFFEVHTPQGLRYTRAGNFKLGADGRLVTSEGHPVLLEGNSAPNPQLLTANTDPSRSPASLASQAPPPAERFVQLAGRDGPIQINERGEIYSGEDRIGRLSVVDFPDLKLIRKAGSVAFENVDPFQNVPIAATQTQVKQGMVETSNVNPVEEISQLIRANRMFEQDLKAMKTVNEMMQKEVNDLGRL